MSIQSTKLVAFWFAMTQHIVDFFDIRTFSSFMRFLAVSSAVAVIASAVFCGCSSEPHHVQNVTSNTDASVTAVTPTLDGNYRVSLTTNANQPASCQPGSTGLSWSIQVGSDPNTVFLSLTSGTEPFYRGTLAGVTATVDYNVESSDGMTDVENNYSLHLDAQGCLAGTFTETITAQAEANCVYTVTSTRLQ